MNLEQKASATQEILARAWQRTQPVIRERLCLLEATAQAAYKGSLPAEIRDPAIAESHKLAGSLGMFGFPHGTELAREIEVLLESSATPPPELLESLTLELRSTLFPSEAAL